MIFFAQLIAWLNALMGKLFGLLHAPMTAMPAWLSLTMISSVLGVALLFIFKYTSPQAAIGRVRGKIKANLLAMKLFKDSMPVVLKSQMKVFVAALQLLACSLPPMLVMALPFCLVLGQLGAWYQAKPLDVNQTAVVMMLLSGSEGDPLPAVALHPSDDVDLVAGPVRVPSRRQVFWEIKATRPGVHQMQFNIGEMSVSKNLSVGSDPMPVSMKKPSMSIGDLILYPSEKPFSRNAPFHSIEIDYPEQPGFYAGSGAWVVTLFVVSMLAALAVKPIFRVKL